MDVVITYVDNSDPEWIKEYKKYSKNNIDSVRFNPHNNLRYCLRSIALNAPFIRKVHLIVSGPSQVPNWINKEEVNIVYHKDIIPEEYLPTFNSRTIEMCMHNIKDLDEQFIYFNDDMFLIKKLSEEDFFKNGKLANVIYVYDNKSLRKLTSLPIYLEPHKRCTTALQKLIDIPNDIFYLTNHGPVPFLKSVCKKVYDSLKEEIEPTLTKFRTEMDYIHFMYYNYHYLTGLVDKTNKFPNIYFNHYNTISSIYNSLATMSSKVKGICFNDCGDSRGEKYMLLIQKQINDLMEGIFPNTSKYEIKPKVSLCVIVKNENRYLKEYVDHYISLGFNNIYLYDNNDIDGENPKDILSEYIENGIVIYNDFRGKKVCQKEAYNHCYKTYGYKCDWMAFFDADEFLELNIHKNISDFVSRKIYEKYECIKINWLCYGDNEQLYYENKPVQERFTKLADYNRIDGVIMNYHIHMNYYQKSIVKTNKNAIFNSSVHYPNNALLCNSDGTPSLNINVNKPIYDGICLKHYITKSTEEYLSKIKRGYPDQIIPGNQIPILLNRYFSTNKYTEQKSNILNK